MVERNSHLAESAFNRSQTVTGLLRESERALHNAFGITTSLRNGQVNFVPSEIVRQIDIDSFIQGSSLARKLRKRNLPVNLIFNPSSISTFRRSQNGLQFFFSSEMFEPLLMPSPNRPELSELASLRALRLFDAISSLVLETLPEEVEVSGKPILESYLILQATTFLEEKAQEAESKNQLDLGKNIQQIAEELKDELENSNDLKVTAEGMRLILKIDDETIVPMVGIYQYPTRHILTSHAQKIFVNHLLKNVAKKYPWFHNPKDPDAPQFDPEIKETVESLLEDLGVLDKPRRLFEYFVTSRLGLEMAKILEEQEDAKKIKRIEIASRILTNKGLKKILDRARELKKETLTETSADFDPEVTVKGIALSDYLMTHHIDED